MPITQVRVIALASAASECLAAYRAIRDRTRKVLAIDDEIPLDPPTAQLTTAYHDLADKARQLREILYSFELAPSDIAIETIASENKHFQLSRRINERNAARQRRKRGTLGIGDQDTTYTMKERGPQQHPREPYIPADYAPTHAAHPTQGKKAQPRAKPDGQIWETEEDYVPPSLETINEASAGLPPVIGNLNLDIEQNTNTVEPAKEKPK